jgi:DNA-binding NarL/FixJ family response regulator
MSSEDTLKSISAKLSAVLYVLMSSDMEKKSSAQKVELLARLGLANQEIADVLGTTKGTVEVLKSRANKKGK